MLFLLSYRILRLRRRSRERASRQRPVHPPRLREQAAARRALQETAAQPVRKPCSSVGGDTLARSARQKHAPGATRTSFAQSKSLSHHVCSPVIFLCKRPNRRSPSLAWCLARARALFFFFFKTRVVPISPIPVPTGTASGVYISKDGTDKVNSEWTFSPRTFRGPSGSTR